MQTISRVIRPRWLAGVMYLAYTLAGASVILYQSSGIQSLLGPVGEVVWNTFIVIGGGVAFMGSALRRHILEVVGLPLLLSSLLVYSIAIMTRVNESDSPGVIMFLSLLIFGSSAALAGRWYEVGKIVRILAEARQRMEREDNG